MERTLIIIKPDAVARDLIGKILSRFEEQNLRVVASRLIQLTRSQAEGFYAEHSERPFFGSLCDFMTSGPCMPVVLEGDNAITRGREIMGATDPAEADDNTIRKDFAESKERNSCHGSDSPESAAREIPFYFQTCDVITTSRA
ncbi:MAG: nucleoside-diphosphate kinase [Candidatus Lindowbacteria bacterium]|nr:nucleoside-diphosphate kinase [Candidatus Lindowbacteria bacterium]